MDKGDCYENVPLLAAVGSGKNASEKKNLFVYAKKITRVYATRMVSVV